jgi:hypothetical protein
MESNLISKIFPKSNDDTLLKTDDEGVWSITLPKEADQISEIILDSIGKNVTIVDCTAGLGGNVISFAKYFKKVIGIELNKNRFDLLENNINVYNFTNVQLINDNCINFISNESSLNNCDVLFFDPPWGGPDYKSQNKISIKLDDLNLTDIMNKIIPYNRPIFLKLPFNYDLNKFSNFDYKVHKIKNYLLVEVFN